MTQDRPWTRAAALMTACVVLSGCAHHAVNAAYPRSVGQTGDIHLILTAPLAGTEVSADGNLLVARAHTSEITVEGVPAGQIDLHLAGYTPVKAVRIEEFMTVDVRPGEVTELEVRVPMEGEGFAAEFTSTSAAFMEALLAGALVFIEIFADDENSDDDPFKPGF